MDMIAPEAAQSSDIATEVAYGTGFALGFVGGSLIVAQRLASTLPSGITQSVENRPPPSLVADIPVIGEDVAIILAPALLGAVALNAIMTKLRDRRHSRGRPREFETEAAKDSQIAELDSWFAISFNSKNTD